MSQALMFDAPPAGLVPPEGSALVLVRGPLDRLFVSPSTHAGFYFVACYSDDRSFGPPHKRGVIAEGLSKPVRADAVLEAVAWLRWGAASSADDWHLLPTAPARANPWLPSFAPVHTTGAAGQGA